MMAILMSELVVTGAQPNGEVPKFFMIISLQKECIVY